MFFSISAFSYFHEGLTIWLSVCDDKPNLHEVFSCKIALTKTGSALPLVSFWTSPISLFRTFLFPFLMASTCRETQQKQNISNMQKRKRKKGLQVRICMRALTSSGCESTTFWQMLCSCALSLTRPKSFSWMICRAVLPDDLHISWNTWGQAETRNTPVRTRM